MNRAVTLYLGNDRADIPDTSFLLMNYAAGDLYDPTIVKNSWSQSIALPRTPNNDAIFGGAFRLDRVNGGGFNPRLRAPFTIYASDGEILESGYFKLNSIDGHGPGATYNVTLYGGLGGLLYGLSYDNLGNPLTLADLDYLETGTPATELDFTINAAQVLSAWQDLEQPGQATIFGVVNFAPAYNGIPDGDFAADKCLFDLDAYEYGAAGVCIANLSKDYTEREMGDYRSYLQRPVLKVSAVLDAIARAASALGYTLQLSGWCYAGNTYAEDTWMTLPMLKNKRTGDSVTKEDLLGSTMSPAAFLLGIVKTFGLMLVCEKDVVTLYKRDDFYQKKTIDLTGRVDLSQDKSIDPLLMDAKWYEFAGDDEGDFAQTYREQYGVPYGCARIDTGYDFDADVKRLTEGVPFRGCVQSSEFSTAFRALTKSVWRSGDPTYTRQLPAPFLDGGDYALPDGGGNQEAKPLLTGTFTTAWWNGTYNGYDSLDLPQLHGPDNKAIDGSGVLLFYAGQPATSGIVLSDDTADMGEEPCWNFSSDGTTALTILPHFTRFQYNGGGEISRALDYGASRELNIPGAAYAAAFKGVYADFWRAYLTDRFDQDTKVLRCRVRLDGLQVGTELLRKFYWYGGSLWVINSISNYSLTTFDPAEVELVQVRDKDAYLNGQY